MKQKRIKLSKPSEVLEFVHEAEKCIFDIDVFYNRVVIDAKSFLGVMSLDLTKVLTVQYHGENLLFEQFLERYAAA